MEKPCPLILRLERKLKSWKCCAGTRAAGGLGVSSSWRYAHSYKVVHLPTEGVCENVITMHAMHDNQLLLHYTPGHANRLKVVLVQGSLKLLPRKVKGPL